MIDGLIKAKDELKRVDHLIYVSLKYTRTVDVFKNIIKRMIASIDSALEAIIEKLKEEEKIEGEIPTQAVFRCNLVKEKMEDERISELINFYLLLRQIDRADFERAREFRRHVTMTIIIDGETMEINIDIITEYYKRINEDVDYIEQLIQGETE